MSKIKASHALVKALRRWEIDHVYGIPGDTIDTVIDALKTVEDEIKFYNVRHEEVASLAATNYTKLTGKIAVSIAIGGPGAIHLLNGMYDAKMDNVPQLVLVGQANTNVLGTKYFQELNLTAMFEDVAVYNKQLDQAENVYEVVNEAIQTAYDKKGVAVLSIPGNLLKAKIEDITTTEPVVPPVQTTVIDNTQIAEAIKLIEQSEKPVVLAGTGVKNAKDILVKFIEHAKLPSIVTLPAKGLIPDTHPNMLGNLGKIGTKAAFESSKEADLLIMIGTNFPYVDYLPDEDVPCIQIDNNPGNIGNRHKVTVPLIGDAKEILTVLNEQLPEVPERPFLEACKENMEQWNSWLDEDRENNSMPLRPERIMAEIEKIADDDAVFSIDVGTSTVWGTRYLRLDHNNRFLTSPWLGTMGCALPGAIASKIAYPDREAIAITGDGAMAMVMQDFSTAVYHNLPMIVVVLNNKQLSFIKYEQQAAGELEYAIDFGDIDFAKFAESCGGVGITVTKPEELAGAFRHAKDVKKPVIINAYVDPDAAPLPGQIVWDEALGYAKFELRSLLEENKLEKMPPLKTIMRRFF
ncbi:pyruvate oxidase [Macrococcoides caseolyticum]|uniref:pyruvate oxidase n=1 Tax=Macrococcoides caseolyticum TaxID=69966 RepID=UPI001F337BCD|nr:pyruvate oxidase [Macrococcus caseolyticus]MCE4956592.1 pyruvate oxidase [Macrococcus caseolyticus]